MGHAYFQLKDNTIAIEYYQQALAIARKVKNREGEGG
ncbi:MAG: tetratricopeptide repeat protein [Rhizonema sp. PD38]|nr:tetratricopeptide repeat protein [Rhizonema sp. PD38]